MTLLSTNLFNEVLYSPIEDGADKLLIVSGYATANMAVRHAEYLKSHGSKLNVELIVGMAVKDGMETSNHNLFKQLQDEASFSFNCNYIVNRPPVHSKIYTWLKGGLPFKTFIGSANYTQNAFSTSMREVLSDINPSFGYDYYHSLIGETINCQSADILDYIELYDRQRIIRDYQATGDTTADSPSTFHELPHITLTLLDSRTGLTPLRSGLNWGQRPGRNPNQAYINIPSSIRNTDFFPEIRQTFTVITDDNREFICVRAQDGGKGLETTLSNAWLGEYFRFRLGLSSGEFVTLQHLLSYGRTDVELYKEDEETYRLDFSV